MRNRKKLTAAEKSFILFHMGKEDEDKTALWMIIARATPDERKKLWWTFPEETAVYERLADDDGYFDRLLKLHRKENA